MIIIPDVHGRTFWKDAVSKAEEGEKIIFLGDYLEPYTGYEPITHEDAYENFLEILEFKRNNMDNVIMLLGNHDFACIDKKMITCRHDYNNDERNRKLFNDNMHLFKIAYSELIGDKTYLFTHAGVHRKWFNTLKNIKRDLKADIAGQLNEMFEKSFKTFVLKKLPIYSRYRGWSDTRYGSCIWADVREWDYPEEDPKDYFENTFQVFGHTQLKDMPIFFKNVFAELDCRKAFGLNESPEKFEEEKDRFEII